MKNSPRSSPVPSVRRPAAAPAWPRLVHGLAALLLVILLAPAAWPKDIRIGLVSDPHVTRGRSEDQPRYRGRFERVVAAVNAAGVDLVLIAGDLTQAGKPEEIADFKALVARLDAPACWVPGNHDLGAKVIPGKSAGPTAARLAAYEKELGPSFYVRVVAGVRVVAVNSPLLGSNLPAEAAMWRLLEQSLAAPTEAPTVVLTHYPLFLHQPDEPGGDYWNIEPAPRARLFQLLERGRVPLVCSGHLHYPLVARHGGTVLVTTMPVSFGLPRGKQPQGWTLLTLRPGEPVRIEPQPVPDPAGP